MKVTKTLNREDIIPLYSDHEEADSRMFVHCEYITNQFSDISNSIKRIIIFSPDTDVAVLCWCHFGQLSIEELWLHTGTGRNRRFIPVHKAVEKVWQDVCNLLPVMHALTGCDSTSNRKGIGKKGGFTTLKKHKDDVVELKNLEMGGPRMRWEILFQNSSHRGSELAGLLSSPVFPCLPAY